MSGLMATDRRHLTSGNGGQGRPKFLDEFAGLAGLFHFEPKDLFVKHHDAIWNLGQLLTSATDACFRINIPPER